jgi:signal transduction histidine kinase
MTSTLRVACATIPAREQGAKQQAMPEEIAMLAHELRRRMAAARVAGEAIAMLRGQGLDTDALLELLLGEIEDLDELAGKVLGDPHRDRTADEATLVDVAAAVEAATRTVALARGVSVRVHADSGARVQASPIMLRQAIENLVDNAAVHGGPDGVEVGVHADPATSQVEVLVADRGASEGVKGGHGIGLFVIRRFLDDAGGRSWMAQREGGGTLVGLSLPLRPAPLDAAVNS